MKFRTRLIAAATLALMGTAAQADVLSVATRTNNWIVNNAALQFVPLNDLGALSVSFGTAIARRVVVTYSAECSVATAAANSTGAWLQITILIDGVPLRPTGGTADAFCSANETASSSDGWVRASVTGYVAVGAGLHTLQIQASGVNGATGLWLGDAALIVVD